METVIITGGTGMVGQALTNTLLDKGYNVIVLSRTPKVSSRHNLSYAVWDIEKSYLEPNAIAAADIIVHLAGESVATKRWTAKRKQEIVDSRVKTSALLVKAIKENTNHIHTIISASAIGWYGPDNEQSLIDGFKETDPVDPSYLGSTCQLWEAGMQPVKAMGIRLVTLRIGIVLNKRGGALAEFIKPANFGLATILGNGKQIVSWIHQQDLCNMIMYVAAHKTIEGVYNAVAPHPVFNKTLAMTVASKIHKFYIPIYVPSFVLKIMLGEMSIEVLKSAKVSSRKIQDAGFEFEYPTIDLALTQILK